MPTHYEEPCEHEGPWNPDLERDGIALVNVHDVHDCLQQAACIVHDPSDHHMRPLPLHWRQDRGIFERVCEHDVGHPDPDQLEYWEQTAQQWQWIHGCCSGGCCVDPNVVVSAERLRIKRKLRDLA